MKFLIHPLSFQNGAEAIKYDRLILSAQPG